MESHVLRDGLAVRPPRLEDVDRIYALVAAYGNAVVGFPDFTPDDVRDELNEPGFAADTDGWLVQDAIGDVLGYATARRRRPDGNQVGVVPRARGRGIARVLLEQAFAADAARGLTGTLLHVDSNNTTPALGLYESVGMRTVLVIDAWRVEVAACAS